MRMTQGVMKAFPKLAAFVQHEMPVLVRSTRILESLQKASGEVSLDNIKYGLVWGQGPLVEPADLTKIGMALYFSGSETIRIHYLLALEFEAGEGHVKAPNGQTVRFLCVLLLHELAHWADELDGSENEDEEVGEAFEEMVWGGRVYPNVNFSSLKQRFGSYEDFVLQKRKSILGR